ncbi:protein FRIGIDA-like [Gossypium australe]|uniref:FRIGIDA-like protein n=1 Tax=Gossypium australe TaxID=47621 RepID=A0A5B6UMM1_9ROSI|nr:protein FRIGIDA-like [Gossypium australe]
MAKPSLPSIKLNYTAIKQDPLDSPPPSLPPRLPLPPPLAVVKTEPEQQQPQQEQLQLQLQEQEQEERQPHLLKSIDDLTSFSIAIQAFKYRFDELTKHLDFINQAIDSKFNEQSTQIEPQPSPKSTQKVPKTVSPSVSSRYGIGNLCKRMCSKRVRKYIITRLSDIPKLREEVPAALKLAPEPAQLVLDCIGRFFLLGKKAQIKDPYIALARQASLLVLEFFLLMMRGEGGFLIAANVKVEARKIAVEWRKRLIGEGGLDKANETDAKGLLLFVACFGIPEVFSNEDLGVLFKLASLSGISDAVKCSPFLPGKIPDIIESMVKNGMPFEAVEVASIFGLEDKFSSKTMLTSFLQESTKAFEGAKQEANKSHVALKKANEKQLDALKSIVHYSENRSIDAIELLGSWQIKEKIVTSEEEIVELKKRIEEKKMKKRKWNEKGSSSTVKSQEMKQSRLATEGSPLPKSEANQLCEQPTTILSEGNGLVPISSNANNSPVTSAAPHGSTCCFPENGMAQMGKANEKQLDALESIVQYPENRCNDVTELLGSIQFEKKIVKLEERVAELHKRLEEKKIKPNRKLDEMGSSSKVKSKEMKQSRFATKGSPFPKSNVNQSHEQPSAILAEGMKLYDGLVPNSCHADDYPVASAAPHGSTNSFPKTEMDQIGGTTNVQSGGISDNGLPYRWQQGYVAQSTSKWFADLFGSSPSIEGFVGLPDRTIRTLADLYRFADSLG